MVCTDEGLSRFDGYRFTNYTTRDGLPHPWVNDLLETHDGVYWVATDGGVSRFNLKRSSTAEPLFVTYVPDQEPDARRVNALAVDPTGIIWLATYNGLYRMEAGPGFRLARCIIGGSKKNRPSRTEEWLCEKH